MYRLTRRQRRRCTLPLVVLLLLHWVCGIGEAAATYIRLEPDGHAKVELAGKRCIEYINEKNGGKRCVDLPADDSNTNDDPLGMTQAHIPDFGLGAAVLPVTLYVLPLLIETPQRTQSAADPPYIRRSVTLRKTIVLLI